MNIWCCTDGESTSDFSFIPTAYVEGEWFKSLAKWLAFWKYPECGPYPSHHVTPEVYFSQIHHSPFIIFISTEWRQSRRKRKWCKRQSCTCLRWSQMWGAAMKCCTLSPHVCINAIKILWEKCDSWGLHMKEQKRVHPRSILTWERTCDLIYPFCVPRCYVESNLNPHSHWTLRVCHHVPTPTRETNRLCLDIYMGAQMELCSTIVNCSCSTRLHMIFWSYWIL